MHFAILDLFQDMPLPYKNLIGNSEPSTLTTSLVKVRIDQSLIAE